MSPTAGAGSPSPRAPMRTCLRCGTDTADGTCGACGLVAYSDETGAVWLIPPPPAAERAEPLDTHRDQIRNPTDHAYARVPRFLGRRPCEACSSPFMPSPARPTLCGPCWLHEHPQSPIGHDSPTPPSASPTDPGGPGDGTLFTQIGAAIRQ